MIAIVDYKAGNLTSVARAMAKIGHDCIVTDQPDRIAAAERVIFPGVGAAGTALASLVSTGLDEAVKKVVADGRPLLGICLGTQIIMETSSENQTTCLGLVAGTVRPFPDGMTDDGGDRLKIPHMGWNHISPVRSHPVLEGLQADDQFYFVHSYYPDPINPACIVATTDYGRSFASVVGADTLVATQFHPEKSGRPGLRLLENFCRWRPC